MEILSLPQDLATLTHLKFSPHKSTKSISGSPTELTLRAQRENKSSLENHLDSWPRLFSPHINARKANRYPQGQAPVVAPLTADRKQEILGTDSS